MDERDEPEEVILESEIAGQLVDPPGPPPRFRPPRPGPRGPGRSTPWRGSRRSAAPRMPGARCPTIRTPASVSWPRPPTTAAGWWCAASTARPGGPGGALRLLAPLRLPHQPGRGHARRRRRAPRPRRGGALHPRPEDQALRHFPSGSFAAKAAWTVIACLAHNMVRWVGQLGLEDETWRAARIILTQPSRGDTPDGCQRRARRRPLSVSGGV